MGSMVDGLRDARCSGGEGAVRTGVDAAVDELRRGRPVIVVDDREREISGDLVLAAEYASRQSIAFLVRQTSGYLCVAAPDERWEHLCVPAMPGSRDLDTAYGVAVDARGGISTGISAADRALTMRLLAAPATRPEDLVRPGHVMTLRARTGGVLERHGRAEATVDLMRLAGLEPIGALGQVVRDDGPTADRAYLRALALLHDLAMVTIGELVAYCARHPATVTRAVTTRIPTDYGEVTLHGYRDKVDGGEHLAMVFGHPENETAPLVRVHKECLTGDAFGSRRCDCGQQLDRALANVSAEGTGVVLYLRGNGDAGMIDKLRALALRDDGPHDTVTAGGGLGPPADPRHLRAAAHILRDLGIDRLRLLTNNPAEMTGLEDWGVTIDSQLPLADERAASTADLNANTKSLGHVLAAS